MPLHDNLERRRREKIAEYRESGACHICECTSGRRSYRRFVGDDDLGDVALCREIREEEEEDAGEEGEEEDPPMRSCMCHGNSDWPYPLRVCEMCIEDDLTTGRIRHCDICGVVACDEFCGAVSLLEATDREEWNNAGCLECRGMESFSEMELFRRKPYPNGIPRATRICADCVELFSLFSFGIKYQFKCRYFKCERLLVPSHVVELKRFLKPFPLSLLPEELMNSIVDFLGGRDLFSFGLVCTSMFRKVEQVSMDVVTRFHHELPPGPVQFARSDKAGAGGRATVYAEGRNDHSLRPPEDGKSWVGVLNQMEQLTRDTFYFGFQLRAGDDGAAMRYLRRRDKVGFERVYSRGAGSNAAITPYFETGGFMMRGSLVLVTRYRWHHGSLLEEREGQDVVRSVIFSTDRVLASGVHRVIVRYYCFCESESLGTVGILRQRRTVDGESVAWAQSSAIVCQGRMEEHVYGMEYDVDRRALRIYKKNAKTSRMESTSRDVLTIGNDGGGDLRFAAALSSGSVGIKGNQLSVRACGECEWSAFLAHTVEKNLIPRLRGGGRRGEERLMRYLDHRARRAMVGEDGGDDLAARVEMERMMDMMMEEEMEGPDNNGNGGGDDDDDGDSDSDFEDGMIVEGGDALMAPPPEANPPNPFLEQSQRR